MWLRHTAPSIPPLNPISTKTPCHTTHLIFTTTPKAGKTPPPTKY